jgi:glycerol-3-phosphate acyltransferase PlsY
MTALALFISYLLGAVPFGVLVGRARGIDVRAVGSGNIGTTNVWRALGPGAGSLVFALDVAKGLAAPLLARAMVGNEYSIVALCALVAVLGHTFSVFLKFKGGKGIATAFGVLLGLNWMLALGLFALWGAVLGLSRMISVASIVACVAAPIAFVVAKQPWPYTAVIVLFATVAIIKHFPNMKRIAAGTEPKLGSKKASTVNSTSNQVVSGP